MKYTRIPEQGARQYPYALVIPVPVAGGFKTYVELGDIVVAEEVAAAIGDAGAEAFVRDEIAKRREGHERRLAALPPE